MPAPRGAILDRDGNEIVTNRVATVVQLDPRRLPASHRDAALEWGRRMSVRETLPKGHRGEPVPIPPAPPQLEARLKSLGRVIGMSARSINDRIVQQLAVTPYANIRVRVDVPQTMRNYLLEHRAQFPGVAVQQVYLRRYPRARRPRSCSARPARSIPRSSAWTATAAWPRAPSSARTGSSGPTTTTCAARPACRASRSTPRAGRRASGSRAIRGPVTSCARLLTCRSSRRGSARSRASIQGGPGTRGRVRRARPAQRPDPRAGLISDVHAERALEADLAAALRRDLRQAGRLAAVQPRDRRRLSDGLDVQADHGAGGARPRPDHAGHADQRSGFLKISPTQTLHNARGAVNGTISLRRALQVSSDVFFFTLGRDANGLKGQAIQSWARKLGLGHRTGHRPARRDPGHDPRPRLARARGAARGGVRAPQEGQRVRDLRQAPVVARRQRQPRRRPGRRAGDAAADGGRLRGDRERRQDRAAASRRRGRGRRRARARAIKAPAAAA